MDEKLDTDAPIGTFVDRSTIRFDMTYPHPPHAVWNAIVDPAQLAVWLFPMSIQPRVGGRVVILASDDDPEREGTVTACEPPAVIEYRFDRGDVHFGPGCVLRFELSAAGDGCRVVFTHHLAPDTVYPHHPGAQIAGPGTFPPGTCAGWQGSFAEGLPRHLDGRRTPIYDEADNALMARRATRYEKLIAAELLDR